MNEKKMSNFVMAGLFMCLGIMLLGIALDNIRYKPTPTEKPVAAQQETVQEMHQRVMGQMVSAPTGSEVYRGVVHIREGKSVREKHFKFKTFKDVATVIDDIKNGQFRMGKKCIDQKVNFWDENGLLAIGILCEPIAK